MPVRKFRHVADMPAPRPSSPLDPGNLEVACDLTELAYALHPWRFTPGVRRYRSMEEANLHRAAWEREQVRGRGPLGGSPGERDGRLEVEPAPTPMSLEARKGEASPFRGIRPPR